MNAGAQRTTLLVDLDGTLTDPAEGIVGSFRHALATMGRPAPADEDLTWIIGPPLRESFAERLGGVDRAEAGLKLYRERYSVTGLFEASVHDGVQETLETLRAGGVRLVLCTSKPIVYARRILEKFDLARHFDAAYGAELDGRFDDKGDLVARILQERTIAPRACAMLGDRKHDVLGAARSGVPTIGALWGFGREAELTAAGAAALCAGWRDVPDALARLP